MLFYAGTLLPALGFVNIYPMRYSFVADHYQYLAGVGLLVLAAGLLVGRLRVHQAWLAPIPVLLGVLTWRQCQMYCDSRTLWEATIQRNPQAWIAHDHLGAIIGISDVETAMGHYATAQQLNPRHMEAYIGMGNLLLQIGHSDAAIAQYRRAVQARPEHATPYYALGGACAAIGRTPEAVEAYERAVSVDPRFIPARQKLVELYTQLQRSDDAARHLAEIQRRRKELLGR